MMSLLVFKEQLKGFYAKYDIYVTAVVKFLFSFLAFYLINQNIGFMTKLTGMFVPLVLALICSFLPYSCISFLAGGFMLAHLTGISFEVTIIMAIFFLIVALLYYSFHPGNSYILVLTPVLFLLKIPYAIPLLVGLSGGLVSIIPVCCGIFIYYAILYVKQNAGVLTNDASVDMVKKYTQMLRVLFSNKTMLVMVAAFALGILIVLVIRTLSVDYAWAMAIVAGTIAQLVVIFIGDITVDVSVPVIPLLLGVLVSMVIAGIYHFFVFAVDYSRTEYVQFEDDEYYYYVKAVPKITVSTPDVKVQKINARDLQKPHNR